MATRALYYHIFSSVIWALVSYLNLHSIYVSYPTPSYLIIIALALGLSVISVFTGMITQKQLRRLTENGHDKIVLSTVLYLVGALFIMLSALYILFTNVPIGTLAPLFYLVAPMPATGHATTAALYVFWEQKNKQKILSDDFFPSNLRVSPKIDGTKLQK